MSATPMCIDLQLNDGAIPIDVELSTDTQFEFELNAAAGGQLPYYEGIYEVDPRKVSQILETKNKSMRENVVINEIYYAETSNVGGGYTAVIGKE